MIISKSLLAYELSEFILWLPEPVIGPYHFLAGFLELYSVWFASHKSDSILVPVEKGVIRLEEHLAKGVIRVKVVGRDADHTLVDAVLRVLQNVVRRG